MMQLLISYGTLPYLQIKNERIQNPSKTRLNCQRKRKEEKINNDVGCDQFGLQKKQKHSTKKSHY